MLPLRGAIAEVRGARVADEGDGLTAARHRTYPPFLLPREYEGGTGLAVDVQPGIKPLAPDAGGDVDPSLIALPGRLQPAVADRGDLLADRGRLQDDRGRDEEQRLLAAVVVGQGNVPDAVQPFEQRQGAVIMVVELLSRPILL